MAELAGSRGVWGPHLIIMPLSVLPGWQNDAEAFVPALAPGVYVHRGDAEERYAAFRAFRKRCAAVEKAVAERGGKRDGGGDGGRRRAVTTITSPESPDVVAVPDGSGGDDPPPFAAMLTTYEVALRDASQLKALKWCYLVVDEGHRLKNRNSKLGAALRGLTTSHRLLLSGTPLQNNLGELWSLLNFCLPALFDSQDNFETWFAAPFANATVGTSKKAAAKNAGLTSLTGEEQALVVARLHAVLRPFLLRRTKADVDLQLPSKKEVHLLCPMSALQAAQYERVRQGLRTIIDVRTGAASGSVSLSNQLMRLRQICNHPFLLLDEYPLDASLIRASGKFEVLARLLPKLVAAGHRVLIFSQMTQLLDMLQTLLDMVGLEHRRLDGGTKHADREDALKEFRAGTSAIPVFLLSTRAGGVGLNLQGADTVIIFDSDWNPQQDLQAQARAHRIGQTKQVQVIRLISRGPPTPVDAASSPPASGSAAAGATPTTSDPVHLRGHGGGGGGPAPPSPSLDASFASQASARSGGRGGAAFTYATSVEQVMIATAHRKLLTEAAVIGAGGFTHAAPVHDDGDGAGFEPGLGMGGGAEGVSGDVAAALEGRKPRQQTLLAVLRTALADGATAQAASERMRHTGPPFLALSDAAVNTTCARNAHDRHTFAAWDVHLRMMAAYTVNTRTHAGKRGADGSFSLYPLRLRKGAEVRDGSGSVYVHRHIVTPQQWAEAHGHGDDDTATGVPVGGKRVRGGGDSDSDRGDARDVTVLGHSLCDGVTTATTSYGLSLMDADELPPDLADFTMAHRGPPTQPPAGGASSSKVRSSGASLAAVTVALKFQDNDEVVSAVEEVDEADDAVFAGEGGAGGPLIAPGEDSGTTAARASKRRARNGGGGGGSGGGGASSAFVCEACGLEAATFDALSAHLERATACRAALGLR